MKRSLNPAKSHAYQIRGVHRLYARLLEKRISGYDISSGDWYLLRVLWERDGISQKELSQETFLTESSVVTMVNSLAQAGLVTRERDENDKRKFRVLLTEKARDLKDELIPFAREINEQSTEGVDKDDLKTFMKVLSKIKKNLREELG